jgi:hypothetical protein
MTMSKLIFLVSFVVFSIFNLYSQEHSYEVELPQFDKVTVTNGISVFPTKGDSLKAKVTASGIDIDNILIHVKGTTLHIGLVRGIHRDYSVDIHLTYGNVREIDVNSSSRVSFQDTLRGDKLSLIAGMNAQIDADIICKSIDISASSGGSIRTSGKVGLLEAKIRTAGILSATELISDSVYVSVAARGVAKINAVELIEANVRSGGFLTFSSSTKLKRVKTGIGATVIEQ